MDACATIAVIGGGPAGLMAAEILGQHGLRVDLYDAMPSVGRKFLMAGRGGLNLTHTEPLPAFLARYGARQADVAAWLDLFGPDALRDWVRELGLDTFVGSSGRVFPTDMKAAPLLRAWLQRLRRANVRFHPRHRWIGWADGDAALRFATPAGEQRVRPAAVVLALGGASWPRLGSDGAWVPWLTQRGVRIAPLRSANCGFETDWSDHFRERFAGQPVKAVAMALRGASPTPTDAATGEHTWRQGEFMVTGSGIEGSLVYALSAAIRERIACDGEATILLDLAPGRTPERVAAEVSRPRGARSLSSHLQSRLSISGVKAALLRECLSKQDMASATRLSQAIKALPLRLLRPRPIDEAISSAGGVALEALDANLMIAGMPGVFCAGEMLDWEAPTGGYLLTACFASGQVAARGVLRYLGQPAASALASASAASIPSIAAE